VITYTGPYLPTSFQFLATVLLHLKISYSPHTLEQWCNYEEALCAEYRSECCKLDGVGAGRGVYMERNGKEKVWMGGVTVL
jgi:hypothetical protein